MSGRLHPDNRAKLIRSFSLPAQTAAHLHYGAARLYGFLFGKRHQGSANPGPSEFLVDTELTSWGRSVLNVL
jgi:hypothetical protein